MGVDEQSLPLIHSPLDQHPVGEPANIREAFDVLLTGQHRPPAARIAIQWSLDQLNDQLRMDWLGKALDTDDPIRQRVVSATFHRDSMLELVELTMRLVEARNVPGSAQLRRSLRTDFRSSSLLHSMVMLETFALASAVGATVTFEVAGSGSSSPIDLNVRMGKLMLPVEVRVVLLDDEFRKLDQANDLIRDHVMQTSISSGTAIHLVADQAVGNCTEIVDAIDAAVATFLASEVLTDFSVEGVRIHVARETDAVKTTVDLPSVERDMWPRVQRIIAAKIDKGYGAPFWLRMNLLNGIWLLTPWAQLELREQLIVLAEHLRSIQGSDAIAGFVISSGVQTQQGPFDDEYVSVDDCTIGVTTNVPIGRTRRTFIVGSPGREEDVAAWSSLLAAEPALLANALERHGLPTAEELIGP